MKQQVVLVVGLMAVALSMLCVGPVQAQNATAATFQIVEATIDDIHMAFRSNGLRASRCSACNTAGCSRWN